MEITAGEIVILPRNHGHTLGSAPGLAPVNADDLIQAGADGGLARIAHGGGGEPTHIVCGFLGSEEAHNPLLATLPPVLKIDVRQGTSRDWVEASVKFAARELAEGKFASSSVMSRLSELLFVEAVRNYASTLDDAQTGWLKGLKDPYVGRALALLHSRIAAPWTAEMLAAEVALSRSALQRAVRHARRHAADLLPDVLAAAHGQGTIAGRPGNHRPDRTRGRVRFGGRLQPGLQARIRPSARALA